MNHPICHISSVHKIDDTRIFHKQCRTLSNSGYNVALFARRSLTNINVEGIIIKLIPEFPNRILRFSIGSIYLAFNTLRLRSKLVHFHDPELIPIALILKLLGNKVIYDVHEDYSLTFSRKSYLPAIIRPALSKIITHLENSTVKYFDAVICATPAIASRFEQLNKRTVTLENYPRLEEFQNNSHITKTVDLSYVGTISKSRGLFTMLEILKKSGLKLKLAGPFVSKKDYESAIIHPGWKNVEYLGVADRKQVESIIKSSKIGLVLLDPEPNYLDSMPVKLFEYMACGVPFICSDFPLWIKIAADTGAGLATSTEDLNELTKSILGLLSNKERLNEMGNMGVHAVREKYSWNSVSSKLLDTYRELLA